jgi:hypothetical protein
MIALKLDGKALSGSAKAGDVKRRGLIDASLADGRRLYYV